MKKFWNLMLAALVIFGAVACTENQEENVPQAELKPVLSFVANIANDETRVDTVEEDGVWKTVWSENETLIVYGPGTEEYEFTLTDAKNGVFTCYDNGVLDLIGEPVQIDNGYVNSKAGKQGAWIENKEEIVSFDPTANITLEVKSSFFRFSSASDVTLTASTEIFVEDGAISKTVTIPAGDDNWVAFLPNPICTFSYSVGGYKVKEIKKDFVAKKIYNLGELVEAEPCDFIGIVGGHQGWDTANKDAMYLIPGSNTYVRYNVPIAADGFKFYGETSKTVVVEHPAVTTGEEGDYYLVPNSNWKEANARFAIYFFGNGETWVSMEDKNGDGIYVANKPANGKTYPSMIFCRMNPSATANNWNNKWNQTADLTCPTNGNNCYTVKSGTWDKGGGTWSVHTPEVKDAWTEEVEEITSYWFGMNSTDNISNWVIGYSNNAGNDNIKVSDTSKNYDVYFSREADQDWGFVYHFAVVENGSPAPELK